MKDNQLTKIETNVIKDEATALIAQAIDKGVSVETMEKLLAMRRELRAEKAKEEFDKAMAKFQAECPQIEKTKGVKTKAGILAYKYAPIESIVEQVKKALQENGFSYSTNMELIENGTTKVKVSVKVTHSAGHSDVTSMTVPLGNKTDIMSQTQVVAAAQTFAKRYAFLNAFGIMTGDEDNDAKPQEDEIPNKPQQNPLEAATMAQGGYTNGQSKPTFYKEKPVSMKQETLILSQLARTGKRLIDITQGKTAHQSDLTMKEASNVIKILIALPNKKEEIIEESKFDIDQM